MHLVPQDRQNTEALLCSWSEFGTRKVCKASVRKKYQLQ